MDWCLLVDLLQLILKRELDLRLRHIEARSRDEIIGKTLVKGGIRGVLSLTRKTFADLVANIVEGLELVAEILREVVIEFRHFLALDRRDRRRENRVLARQLFVPVVLREGNVQVALLDRKSVG